MTEAGTGQAFTELNTGLDHIGFPASSREELVEWQSRFEATGVPFTPIRDMEFGYHLNFRDPDNIPSSFSRRIKYECRAARAQDETSFARGDHGSHQAAARLCATRVPLTLLVVANRRGLGYPVEAQSDGCAPTVYGAVVELPDRGDHSLRGGQRLEVALDDLALGLQEGR
jgi:hypothetical protein